MSFHGKNIKIFAANASWNIAKSVSEQLGLPLGRSDVSTFSDGEISISFHESVRGCEVFLVQSTCAPVNDNIMELLIMIDACKRASAGCITAVIPYFGYARQDRKAKARDPISAKLMADILTAAGAERVLTMDLHAAQIQGFFDIPVDNLNGVPVLAPYFQQLFGAERQDVVIVSPDFGSVTRARAFSQRFGNAPIAIIDKRRPKANVCEVMNIIGDVKDKRVILVDDMIDTAGTLCNAAKAVMDIGGAKEVYACATHGVLSGSALERIENSPLKEVVLLDTIPAKECSCRKIKYLPVAPVFAEAISRISSNRPVSTMFN